MLTWVKEKIVTPKEEQQIISNPLGKREEKMVP
jgi:hypothetical protein